jgi:chromosome segregation ATPase
MTRDEIKGELTELREAVNAGFARSDGELTALREAVTAGFARTDGDLTALREAVTVGFARADRYFELQHVQLQEVIDRLDGLSARVDRLERELQSLRSEFSTFRDWVTREFAEVHSELRELRQVGAAQSAEIQQLSARVDRLEHRWNGLGGAQTGSTP